MSITICLAARTLYYPSGGGHLWAYLNWALGFKNNGFSVLWLEGYSSNTSITETKRYVKLLKENLKPFNLHDSIVLYNIENDLQPSIEISGCVSLNTAIEQSDLLLNQNYALPKSIVSRFKKTVLLDIDPGLTQLWITKNHLSVAPHHFYFTIGETVGQHETKIPNAGIHWHYVPPCVSLENWNVVKSSLDAPLTTISHWSMNEWEDDYGSLYSNDKRTGFLPFLNLPEYSSVPLELAILLGDDEEYEREKLEKSGWRVKDSHSVAPTPQDYQYYIQNSKGEFSCVKPSCVRLQNAWISDRTLCYLASGKPAVVQHTGPSRFLPDCAGLLRFKNFNDAIRCLEEVVANYDKHCAYARALAEEYFDAKKVTKSLLERVFN